ncbi:MAG TPA: alpha/beta hydrolase [Acidimicrobiales bacterium]|nr:alpha/beta hydrolase [Acidimicrobiales bacterium]
MSARDSGVVDIDGLPVFYETEGSGPPLVLLHGGMADNSTWTAQFAGLSPHRRVIAPERRAHGHTPDPGGPLTYQAMAEETVEFLRFMDLGPADLVGWSDGGMVAFLVAVSDPDLVKTITMVGASVSSDGYVEGTMEEMTGLPADDDEMAMFEAMYAAASPDGPAHFPEVWDKIRTMWSEKFDWWGDVATVSAPALVMVGDDDLITVSSADQLARRLPAGQLAVIPGASHVAPMEKPDLFNQLVLDFTAHPVVETMMPVRRQAPG